MEILNHNCFENPRDLNCRRVCLYPISKDIKGHFSLVDRDLQECKDENCKTLKADWFLKAKVESHEPCDSQVARALDGVFSVRQLVNAFVEGNGENRGIHTGMFEWFGSGVQVQGHLSGVTNVGTHREPAFDPCQKCHAPGFMEGQLCGDIIKTEDKRLRGCKIRAAYRFRFDPNQGANDSEIYGTVEGLVVCPCGKAKCIDFRNIPQMSHSNPWTIDGCVFLVRDYQGNQTPTADVVTWGALTGLNANYETTISLAAPAAEVEITLVHFSSPATVIAMDNAGAVVDSQTMSAVGGVAETLHLSGGGIETVVVRPPQNETLILEVCAS